MAVETLDKLQNIIARARTLGDARGGDLIRSQKWNDLVSLVVELAQEVAADRRNTAVPPHEHPDQVKLTWLDPQVRALIEKGPLSDPKIKTRFFDLERDVQKLSTDMGGFQQTVFDARDRLTELTTKELIRDSAFNDVSLLVGSLADRRDEVFELRKTLGSITERVNIAVDASSRFVIDDKPADLNEINRRLQSVEELRTRLTTTTGALLDAGEFDRRLITLQNNLVTKEQLDTVVKQRTSVDVPEDTLNTIRDNVLVQVREETRSTIDKFAGDIRSETDRRLGAVSTSIPNSVREILQDQLAANVNPRFQAIEGAAQTLATRFTTLDTTTRSLDTRFTALDATAKTFETRIATVETTGRSVETRVGAVETSQRDLGTRVGAVETTATGLGTRFTAVEDIARAADSRVTAIDNTTRALTTRITGLETTANALLPRVTGIENATTALAPRVTSLETATRAFEPRFVNIETAARGLTTRVGTVENTAGAFGGRIGAVETAVAGFEPRIGAVADTARVLTARVTAAETTATGLADRVTGVETTTRTLEPRFAAIETAARTVTARLATVEGAVRLFPRPGGDIDISIGRLEPRVAAIETTIQEVMAKQETVMESVLDQARKAAREELATPEFELTVAKIVKRTK